MNQCIPAGYPETHAPLVPQAQTEPTRPTPIKGSRSPSKLGFQASNTWDLVSVWCLDLHLSHLQSVGPEKSQNPWQEHNEPSRSHKQVCAQDNKSVTWLPSTATVLNRHEQGKQCNQPKHHWPRDTTCYTHQYPYHIPALSPFFLSSFYYESNNNPLLWVTAGYSHYQKPKHSSYSNLHRGLHRIPIT